MKRRLAIGCLLIATIALNAQFVAEVLSYRPAPGQFINEAPWGEPSSARSIVGGIQGSLSLGAFGGEVVFRFDQPVENHPDNPYGVDFTVFGNPLPDWSEPGAVWVLKDRNGNGLPDDPWYELAGSDHWFSSTVSNEQVTYTDPGRSVAADVPWVNLDGAMGSIRANGAHGQPHYPLPDSFSHGSSGTLVVKGTRITGVVDVDHPPVIRSVKRAFGYADNQSRGIPPWTLPDNPYTPGVENSGGDAFDLDWAVDSAGNYVELDQVDFIRVRTAILHQGGWLGEISTEVTGAVDVAPEPGHEGPSELLVIRDLPPEIGTGTLKLEGGHFRKGRPVADSRILWSTDRDWATVEEGNLLKLQGTGPLTVTAALESQPGITATSTTNVVDEPTGAKKVPAGPAAIRLYPNPAGRVFRISGSMGHEVAVLDPSGHVVARFGHVAAGEPVDISFLPPGWYLVRAGSGAAQKYLKLMIH